MKEELRKDFADIFENIQEYALVKHSSEDPPSYSLYRKPTMAFVLVEEQFDKLVKLLISKGIQVANSIEEIRPKDFKPKPPLIWDEEKKEWKQVSAEEFDNFMEERAKRKGGK
jgi:hypothetical protein